jgi:hypothetical protein
MNIGGFENRQIPFSVFRSRPHPHFLSPPSLAHTPLPLPLTRPSVPPPCPARCLLTRSARRLLAHPTVGAASLPGLLPPHSLSPPSPCSPGRRCRLLTQPAASSLTSTRPSPPDHRLPITGHRRLVTVAGGPAPPLPGAIIAIGAPRVTSSSASHLGWHPPPGHQHPEGRHPSADLDTAANFGEVSILSNFVF